jgi:plasmid segregation protein ParM
MGLNRVYSWPVAVDVGFAELKVASYAKQASGAPASEIRTLVEPSLIERGGKRMAMLGTGDRIGRAYRTVEPDGSEEVWSHRSGMIRAEDTRIPNYHISSLNRALVAHGLVRAAEAGVIPSDALATGITISTSVPVKNFLTPDGGMNKAYLNQKHKWLLNGQVYYLGADGKEHKIQIDRHYVYCQAIAAWCDYVYDERGDYIEERASQEIGVVDVGGETSDFTVMVPVGDDGHAIDGNRSGSERTGVLLAVDELRTALSERLREEVPASIAREVLTRGVSHIRGSEIKAPDLVNRVCRTLAARVGRDMARYFRGAEGMIGTSRIIVVGGGAALLDRDTMMADYPQAEFLAAPQFANARGMLRYMAEQELSGEYFRG